MSDCSCAGEDLDGGIPASSSTPSVPGAPGWSLAARVPFRELPSSASPIPNGAVNIDGDVWTAANGAVATTWRNLAGSGLQFAALAVGGNTGWTASSQTATNISIALEDLIEDYDPTRRYLFELLMTANNGDAVSERVCLSLLRTAGVPTGATLSLCWAYSGFDGTAARGGFGSSNSGGTGSTDYTFALGYDVIAVLSSPESSSGAQGFVGQSDAGDFPPNSDLRPTTGTQQTGTPLAITADSFTDGRCRLVISFPTGNSSGTFVAEIAELRVLVAA